jgi:glycosyltransferase involved in cell wall biosynthesis
MFSTDLAIAVSRSTAEFVIGARQVPRTRTRIVYLGAPLEDFARARTPEEVQAIRSSLGLPATGPVVGTVTRLMPSKGNRYLVEAARLVLNQDPDVHFCIVGEGELLDDLKQRARRLGIAERVRFAGFTRDVAGAFAAFDVVVFPSLWEGTPLTVFEALAAGRPIVATDADGLKDILHDGHDSVIVPKHDASAIAGSVLALLGDPDRREKLAGAARRTGVGYDITTFVRKMERLYCIMHESRNKLARRGLAETDLSFLSV